MVRFGTEIAVITSGSALAILEAYERFRVLNELTRGPTNIRGGLLEPPLQNKEDPWRR